MKTLLSLGAVIAIRLTQAQGVSFALPQYTPIGLGCCSVLTGDFNKDGNADIAAAYRAGGITVLLGHGRGGFTRVETPAVTIPGVIITSFVALADINSDGIPDIIAIAKLPNFNEQSVAMLGRGDGTFQSPVFLDNDPVKAVGDFNGDGKPDLLVYTGFGNRGEDFGFAVRLGNGDGTFRTIGPVSHLGAGDFSFAVIADFNRDGKADVVQTSFRETVNGYVYVWLGNGDGTFGDVLRIPLSSGYTELGSIAVGDFDGDGKPDLAVQEYLRTGAQGVEILLGNGDGTFRTKATYSTETGEGPPVLVADFNGDGRMDVALGFTVLLGNGDGTLQPPAAFGQFNTSVIFNPVAVADFNGDGKPDLVGGGGYGTQLSVMLSIAPAQDASANAVSAATYIPRVALGSIVTLFGTDLAATTATASGLPLPTTLGGTKVRVLDEVGVERLAGLAYVSPTQINLVLPAETAIGLGDPLSSFAIFNVDNGKTPSVEGARSVLVRIVAAGFFTADGSGQGPPAATAVRVHADGSRTDVPVFQCSSATSCQPVPIDLAAEGAVYLTLYGTGFRNTSSFQCFGFDLPVLPVLYAGPHPIFAGLDQVNVQLPTTLPSGTANLACSFATRETNAQSRAPFTILIK